MNKKILAISAGLILSASSHVFSQAAVGAVSPNRNYAAFDVVGNLTNANLYDHAGKIVVIFYYTPW